MFIMLIVNINNTQTNLKDLIMGFTVGLLIYLMLSGIIMIYIESSRNEVESEGLLGMFGAFQITVATTIAAVIFTTEVYVFMQHLNVK